MTICSDIVREFCTAFCIGLSCFSFLEKLTMAFPCGHGVYEAISPTAILWLGQDAICLREINCEGRLDVFVVSCALPFKRIHLW